MRQGQNPTRNSEAKLGTLQDAHRVTPIPPDTRGGEGEGLIADGRRCLTCLTDTGEGAREGEGGQIESDGRTLQPVTSNFLRGGPDERSTGRILYNL